MQLDTLVMDPKDAKERLDQYRKLVDGERTTEDEAIAAGYRAAARGLPVISLKAAFAAAGTMEVPVRGGTRGRTSHLPRLAIARANAREVWVHQPWNDPAWLFRTDRNATNYGALVGKKTVRVPAEIPDGWHAAGKTIVPVVPPQHRPRRTRLHLFHILWEVDKWTMEPPVDPALLRHIRGDLWSVVATWDLTPLERAVLAQRAT
jgi:hypothetical protein